MIWRSYAAGFFVIMGMLSGCASRPPAVLESVDPTGLPIRLEVEEEEEPSNPALIRQRMDEYRRRASTRPIAMVAALQPVPPDNFDPFIARDCPPEGSAIGAHKMEQNRLKNRLTLPQTGDIDASVTLAKLRKSGDDTARWSSSRAATIVGYIKSVHAGGPETCNCGASGQALTDAHIDVISSASDHRKPVIVEITPLWRMMHDHAGTEDWSSLAVRNKYEGKRVRITGWLFFDDAHIHEADNTDPGDHQGKKNWRKTCWEIHPVTGIEILP